MNFKRTLHSLSAVFICLLLTAGQAASQGSWQDGNPSFIHPYSVATNVVMNSTVQLISTPGESQESASFLFVLNGLDWRWPVASLGLPAAEDIDYHISRNKMYYLVTDGTQRRIFEVNVAQNLVVWEFISDQNELSPRFLRHPTDAFWYTENDEEKYLVTDMGRNRIIKIDRYSNEVEWSYGESDNGWLNSPADALAMPDTNQFMICDKGNNRILVVNEDSSTAWEWGQGILNNPVDIEFLSATSQILITDQLNHKVIIVSYPDATIDFEFGLGFADASDLGLNTPSDADTLPNGNILICDAGNKRLIEVDRSKNIFWRFHRPLEDLKDADRLPDGRTLAIYHDSLYNKSLPARLAYTSAKDSSDAHDLGRKVIFDSLSWQASTEFGVTSVKLQLRTAATYSELVSAAWMGPVGAGSFYTTQPAAINALHNGDRWYQFKAFLESTDPLLTPSLENVKISFHYFNTDCTGILVSEPISDVPGFIITSWDSLIFNTRLPEEDRDALKIGIQILDGVTDAALFVHERTQYVKSDTLRLFDISKLTGVQSIKLKATLNTLNSSITPVLEDWRILWTNTNSTKAQLNFVDENVEPVTHYRVSTSYAPGQKYVNWVRLSLFDGNIIPIHNTIELMIRAAISGDSMKVLLKQSAGIFSNTPGKPAIVSDFVDYENTIFEIADRDTLTARYVDPTDPTDSTLVGVVMVLNTDAKIRFEDRYGAALDSARLSDTVYVRITGERDHDFSPEQDTIYVRLQDAENGEDEIFAAVEQPDTLGQYTTGIFLTEAGIPLVGDTDGVRRDSLVQTNAGRRVVARYEDNGTVTATLRIPSSGNGLPIVVVSLDQPYDFIIAPNPFYADRHTTLRLRAASRIGDMQLKSIEIFNLAGEKIRLLEGNIFSGSAAVPQNRYTQAEDWWDLKSESGHQISSGTYWAKFNAVVFDPGSGQVQSVYKIKKILILR
ncbi:hypothetical protein JXJ21_00840 [candidate division KSB1 bacterium]|nr:hypothetical protein [candidate division KSB1 bacterium]